MTIRERENQAKSNAFENIVMTAYKKYDKEKKDIMTEGKDVFLAVLRHFADDKFHTAKEMANWTKGNEFPLSAKEIAGNLYAMGRQKYCGGSRYEITVHKSVRQKELVWVLLDENGEMTNVSKKTKGVNEYRINKIC